ncbi:energy-coupling factor transporter ATPase [Curtanaerobium respiraculi]|uniref:energy-coupling factor transporter ATPase n=1 Tax=Curtanaerobium respiraculi TaxID=2949669 RepID=UPI0024B35E9E|nr:energy-coupling factor transporter ATPase [Curtanaerobium respiraculi]
MIEFQNVGFTYDGETFVLDGIDLSIGQGEFACILGGNGSGKSTLAKHVNALLAPDRGTVRVLGKDTSDPEAMYFIRSNAGMVFQNPDDQLVANPIENDVAFGPENLGVPADELRRRVADSLARVGLQGFERRETTALSGGQKQRVAIAGVLAMDPRILILDEASAMLDPRGRKSLLRVAHELNDAGMTIIMITHFMEEAAGTDRVFVLDAGHMVLSGTPAEVFAQADLLASLSLDNPFAVKMSRALQQRGVRVPLCISEEQLADAIACLARTKGGSA